MPTAAPVSVAPVSVTILLRPAFASAKSAVPPLKFTTSVPSTPVKVWVSTVAVVVAS